MARINLDDTEIRAIIENMGKTWFVRTDGVASQEDAEKMLEYQAASGLNQDYLGQKHLGESN